MKPGYIQVDMHIDYSVEHIDKDFKLKVENTRLQKYFWIVWHSELVLGKLCDQRKKEYCAMDVCH